MKFKKTVAAFLSVTVLSCSAVAAYAANTEDLKTINFVEQREVVMPVSGGSDAVKQSYFGSFTGTVKKITDFEGVKGSKFVLVENEKGDTANIIISKDTYVVNDTKLAEGSVITGYYEANAPMLMIYPPQYNAEVVVVADKDQNVKVDTFGKDLVSSDNSLKLNISDNTEIILQDGKAFDGELANRKLVVTYTVSTRSIPAQTTPSKIVVLLDKVDNKNIVVNGKKIDAPSAYINKQGTVMVPLRAISEALGFDVTWIGQSKSVMIGKGISLTQGVDNYIYMKTAPIQLGTAPEVVDDKTFVPLSFFKEVVRMNTDISGTQIVIGDGEIMK